MPKTDAIGAARILVEQKKALESLTVNCQPFFESQASASWGFLYVIAEELVRVANEVEQLLAFPPLEDQEGQLLSAKNFIEGYNNFRLKMRGILGK